MLPRFALRLLPRNRLGICVSALFSLCVTASMVSGASEGGGDEKYTAPVEMPIQLRDAGTRGRLAETKDLIQVNRVRQAYGVDGSGLAVAVMDTGLKTTHVDFAGRIAIKLNFTSDYGSDPFTVADGHGHGTNVTGIVAANGKHVGMAPAADICAIKVLTNTGGIGSLQKVKEALIWIANNHDDYNISVVNLSFGDGRNHLEHELDGIQEQIRILREKRVAVVAAAGNSFFSHKSKQGMSFPAIFPETISVGAVFDGNIGFVEYRDGSRAVSTAARRIAPFSQRLHASVGDIFRMDLFAPGASLTSTGTFSDVGTSVMDGTSQATAVTSGVILLMQEYYLRSHGEMPEVDDIERWLRIGSVTINDGDDEEDNVKNTKLDYPLLDAWRAFQAMGPAREPVFLSPVQAFPTTGAVGHPVTFRAYLDAPTSDAYPVRWSFGDGTQGEGAEVQHTYGATGVYVVTATATGAGGSVATDQLELQVDLARLLTVDRFRLRPRRGRRTTDQAMAKGSFLWPKGLGFENTTVHVDVSGARMEFALDLAGRARNDRNSLRFRRRRVRRAATNDVVGDDQVSFSLRLRDGDWADRWQASGILDQEYNLLAHPVSFMVTVKGRSFFGTALAKKR